MSITIWGICFLFAPKIHNKLRPLVQWITVDSAHVDFGAENTGHFGAGKQVDSAQKNKLIQHTSLHLTRSHSVQIWFDFWFDLILFSITSVTTMQLAFTNTHYTRKMALIILFFSFSFFSRTVHFINVWTSNQTYFTQGFISFKKKSDIGYKRD